MRMFNIAWAESKMEGGIRELDTLEEQYMKMIQENNGEPLTDVQWEELHRASKSAGLITSLVNFPIIFLSNNTSATSSTNNIVVQHSSTLMSQGVIFFVIIHHRVFVCYHHPHCF